jgi:hypothetical protein
MSRRIVLSLAVLAFTAGLAPLAAQSCPDNFVGQAALAEGKAWACTCAAGQTGSGSVWGTDRYTADSSICRAALHAGVIPAGGGKVTLWARGGCGEFAGTSRNGVQTSNWGGYDRTFSFEKDARCLGEAPADSPASCPDNAVGLKSRAPESGLECHCAPSAMRGAVWGTDLYTLDSSVCAAARHAGAVGEEGGSVTLFVAGRCESFAASARNGIDTGSWGPYDATFAFAYPVPACADGSKPKR